MLPFHFLCAFVKKGTALAGKGRNTPKGTKILFKANKHHMLPSAVQRALPKKSHIKEKEQRASQWFSPLSSVPCSVLSLGTRSTKAIHHLSFCVALVLYLISSLPLHHIALTWEGTTGLSGRNCGWTVKIQILNWSSKSLSMTLETSLSFPYLSIEMLTRK